MENVPKELAFELAGSLLSPSVRLFLPHILCSGETDPIKGSATNVSRDELKVSIINSCLAEFQFLITQIPLYVPILKCFEEERTSWEEQLSALLSVKNFLTDFQPLIICLDILKERFITYDLSKAIAEAELTVQRNLTTCDIIMKSAFPSDLKLDEISDESIIKIKRYIFRHGFRTV